MAKLFTLYAFAPNQQDLYASDYDSVTGFGAFTLLLHNTTFGVQLGWGSFIQAALDSPTNQSSLLQVSTIGATPGVDILNTSYLNVLGPTQYLQLSVNGFNAGNPATCLGSPWEWGNASWLAFLKENSRPNALSTAPGGMATCITAPSYAFNELDAANADVPGYGLLTADFYTAPENGGVVLLLYQALVVDDGGGNYVSGGTTCLLREFAMAGATHSLLDLSTLVINGSVLTSPAYIPSQAQVLRLANGSVAVIIWARSGVNDGTASPLRPYLTLLTNGVWSSDVTGWLPLDGSPWPSSNVEGPIEWAYGPNGACSAVSDDSNAVHVFMSFINPQGAFPVVTAPYAVGTVQYQFYVRVDCSSATPTMSVPQQLNGIMTTFGSPLDFPYTAFTTPTLITPRVINNTIYAGIVWFDGDHNGGFVTFWVAALLIGSPLSAPTWEQSTPVDPTFATGIGRPLIVPLSGRFNLTMYVIVQGGTATADEWEVNAAGPDSVSGPGTGVNVTVIGGAYTFSLVGVVAGYTNGTVFSVSVNGATPVLTNTITFTDNDVVVASIVVVFNAIAATLTLVKAISGGAAPLTDWTLNANGPSPLSGAGGATGSVTAGTYDLSETGSSAGYTNGTIWSIVVNGGAPFNATSVVIAGGDVVTATITNIENATSGALTLLKTTTGGSAPLTDWVLSASGPTPITGTTPVASPVAPGTYDLSETGSVTGYVNGTTFSIVINGAPAVISTTVTIGAGDVVVATITNLFVGVVATVEVLARGYAFKSLNQPLSEPVAQAYQNPMAPAVYLGIDEETPLGEIYDQTFNRLIDFPTTLFSNLTFTIATDGPWIWHSIYLIARDAEGNLLPAGAIYFKPYDRYNFEIVNGIALTNSSAAEPFPLTPPVPCEPLDLIRFELKL